MKRSLKNVFIILVLVSLIIGGVGVIPVRAASTMHVVALTLPAGWRSGFLYGVWGWSAGDATASDVYAVGYGNSGTDNMPLLFHKQGGNWTTVDLAIPDGWSSGHLFGVWGSSASDVYAAGYGYNGNAIVPLLYQHDGSSWTSFTVPLPSGVTSGSLYSIWGSSASDIYAVGYGFAGSTLVPLLYQKNSGSWTAVEVSTPFGWSSLNFKAVWGFGPTDVYVVGSAYNGSTNVPLLHHKSGSSWTTSALSLPSDRGSGYLSGMWGSSATDAYVAGYGYNGNTPLPLMYHMVGSTWTESSPTLTGGLSSGFLYSVWGSGASDVYVVGSGNSGSTPLPLMYHNDGNSWIETSPSLPAGWSSGSLFSVWGSNASDVYAVGSGNNGITDLPLLYQSSGAGQDLVAPGIVTGFSAAAGTSNGSVNLSWTAPADDDGSPVTAYLVKYSTSPFTNWSNGTAVTIGLPTPGLPGTPQSMTVSGLIPDSLYYFAIRAQDEQYNLSPDYVTASATAQGGSQVPGKVTLVAPSGSINSNRPTYSWTADNAATWYYLWVDGPSGNVIKQWYTSAQANCNGSTCSVTHSRTLGAGAHRWWIQTYNSLGYGPWSEAMNFNTPVLTLPGKATLISPTGGIGISAPTYTWNQVPGATWYYLWVNGPSGNVIKQWYTSAQANCNGSTCFVTPATSLATGAHTWWIQTWNNAGYGPWSDGMNFSAPLVAAPFAATLISPAGEIETNAPTYTWSEVSNSTWYYLWVNGPSGNVIRQWYTSAQANCNGSTCSVTPATNLATGAHTWWIQTWNNAGYGPWSDGAGFTTP